MRQETSSGISSRTTQSSSYTKPPILTKKASKLSLQLNQLEHSAIKESEDPSEKFFNIIDIKVNLLIDFNNNDIKTYSFKISDDTTVSAVISSTIESFNNEEYEIELDNNLVKVELTNDITGYMLKKSKKNNMPKDDYPPFYSGNSLRKCETQNFSLIINNKECVMFHRIKKQSGKCKNKCIVF